MAFTLFGISNAEHFSITIPRSRSIIYVGRECLDSRFYEPGEYFHVIVETRGEMNAMLSLRDHASDSCFLVLHRDFCKGSLFLSNAILVIHAKCSSRDRYRDTIKAKKGRR